MATTDSHVRISLTEHEIILAQREQKLALAAALQPAADLSDQFIDAMSAEDARHTLKVYSVLARTALDKTRLSGAGLSDLQRLAIACGNDPYTDEMVCPQCKGCGHVPALAETEAE